MTVYETFCGIGGFSLGFKRAGFEIIGGCEIDPYARAVYEKNFGIKPDGDIRSIESIPADIICGGFPCQDISNANANGKGLEGERSGLWWELARIIKNSSPRYVVLENVSALLQQENGMGDILRFFSEIGYDVEWDCLRASDFGAPHIRNRVWIVANPNSARRWNKQVTREKCEDPTNTFNNGTKGSLAYSDSTHELSKQGFNDRIGNSSETMAYTECERFFEGYINKEGQIAGRGGQQHTNWTIEPDVGRVVNGLPYRSHRIKCLGNSIVPQISQWIAQRIKEIDSLPPSDNEKLK